MFLLALETSDRTASIALVGLSDGRPVATATMASAGQTARWLAQAVHDMLKAAALKPADIAVLALARGPGSFTGLRIGVTFAKVFCYANGSRLVAVDTLEVLAHQAASQANTVHAVTDALRGESFYAAFNREPTDSWRRLGETRLVSNEQLTSLVQPPSCLVGRLRPEVRDGLPQGITLVEDMRACPQATTVADLARRRIVANQFDDPWTLQPMYLRLSYAEEKFRPKSPST